MRGCTWSTTDRERRYASFLLEATRIWTECDRLAPVLGVTPAELVEDGRRLWLRAGTDGNAILADLRALAVDDSAAAEAGGRAMPDEADRLRVACPRCQRPVWFTLGDLITDERLVCTCGQRVAIAECDGVSEVARFISELIAIVVKHLSRAPLPGDRGRTR